MTLSSLYLYIFCQWAVTVGTVILCVPRVTSVIIWKIRKTVEIFAKTGKRSSERKTINKPISGSGFSTQILHFVGNKCLRLTAIDKDKNKKWVIGRFAENETFGKNIFFVFHKLKKKIYTFFAKWILRKKAQTMRNFVRKKYKTILWKFF